MFHDVLPSGEYKNIPRYPTEHSSVNHTVSSWSLSTMIMIYSIIISTLGIFPEQFTVKAHPALFEGEEGWAKKMRHRYSSLQLTYTFKTRTKQNCEASPLCIYNSRGTIYGTDGLYDNEVDEDDDDDDYKVDDENDNDDDDDADFDDDDDDRNNNNNLVWWDHHCTIGDTMSLLHSHLTNFNTYSKGWDISA